MKKKNDIPSQIAKLITEDPSVLRETIGSGWENYDDITIEEFTYPEFFGDLMFSIEAQVAFNYTPGEEPVMYYRDGSGYPGSDPELEWEISDIYSVEAYDISGNPVNFNLTPDIKAKLATAIKETYDDEWLFNRLDGSGYMDDDYDDSMDWKYEDRRGGGF